MLAQGADDVRVYEKEKAFLRGRLFLFIEVVVL